MTATTTATTTAPAPPARARANVYFIRDEVVAPVARPVTPPSVAREAMEALLEGPTEAERAAGLTSSVPEGTRLLDLDISDGLATVDLSAAYESGGGSLSMLTRVAQVVHTLTWFPTVERVRFRIEGQDVDAIGGEGVVVDEPLGRADVEGQAPAILVERPTSGEEASSPLRVSGTANTFEARFVLRVVGASGDVLAERQVTATSGTGTRGTFSTRVRFSVPAAQDGALVAFERSARDGRPVNRVRVPLRLVP